MHVIDINQMLFETTKKNLRQIGRLAYSNLK